MRLCVRRWALVAFLLSGAVFGQHSNPALADDNEDMASAREQITEALQNDLEQMSRSLGNAVGSSSEDDIANAIDRTRAIKENVDKLKDVQGDDSTASRIVDDYPRYVDDFTEAAKGFLLLKRAQLEQEKRDLARLCPETDKALRETVGQYLQPPDPAGLDKIPEAAERAKSTIADLYAREKDQANDTKSAYDNAHRFSASGDGWSDVSGQLRDSADSLWSKYDARLKEVDEKCTELSKGKDSAFIVEALSKLNGAQSDSRQVLDSILKDWNDWKQRRRDLANNYVLNANKIRMAICDDDEEQILSRVEQVEEAAQSALKGPYETLDKDLDQLIDRLNVLENDKAVGADARRWRGVMRGAKTRLTSVLRDGGILQGVQNAKVRARLDIGIRKHQDYQSSSSNCTASEVQVSSGRIDCVKVDSGWCNIIEIKPNNDNAVKKGWDQVKRYQSDVLSAWQSASDKSTMQPEVFRDCLAQDESQELQLKTDVVTYDFCPVPDEDIDAMLAEQIKQAGSSEDE